MASTQRQGKTRLQNWLNYRVRIGTVDGRILVGSLLAFDKYMNLVLGDSEEFRRIKNGGEEKEVKKVLGLVVLRGEVVVSVIAEAPPPGVSKAGKMPAGPGKASVTGRGAPIAGGPAGLTGPTRGVGGPAPAQMQPRGR